MVYADTAALRLPGDIAFKRSTDSEEIASTCRKHISRNVHEDGAITSRSQNRRIYMRDNAHVITPGLITTRLLIHSRADESHPHSRDDSRESGNHPADIGAPRKSQLISGFQDCELSK